MFIQSNDPNYLELDEFGLQMLNEVIIHSDEDPRLRAFILHAFLAGAQYDPDIAKLTMITVMDACANGVDATLKTLTDTYDQQTGADRVEQALASGIL